MPPTSDFAVPADEHRAPSTRQETVGKFGPAGAVVAVALMSGIAGWSLHDATHHDQTVRVYRVFTATVTIVNQQQTSGCVRPDTGGKIVCAALVANPAVHANQHVRVASVHVDKGGGNGYPLLVVLPDNTD